MVRAEAACGADSTAFLSPQVRRYGERVAGPCGSAHCGHEDYLLLGFLALSASVLAEPIGEVDTVFKLVGPDHQIVMDAHDDPKVNGVTCYVSRAKTGGIKGAVGLAEDKAEASIACRQVGPISFREPVKRQEEMFSERISLVSQKLRVVRMFNSKRNELAYLTYSDRVIDFCRRTV